MGLSPVVKTQLPIPTRVSATSLQNPAETQESLIFLPFVMFFSLFPSPPPPGPWYTVILSPKPYKTVQQGLQCLHEEFILL